MIKKFNQYNESIRDKMTPKSEEEVDEAKKNLLKRLKEYSLDPDNMAEELSYYLQSTHETAKDIIIDLIEHGLDARDLLIMITDELDLNDNPTEADKRYKLRVMDIMYRVIKENIDKLEDLE